MLMAFMGTIVIMVVRMDNRMAVGIAIMCMNKRVLMLMDMISDQCIHYHEYCTNNHDYQCDQITTCQFLSQEQKGQE